MHSSKVRYHIQDEKKSDFQPGILSDELRNALDLKPNQIPLYIYRMRLLSYPPGWLQEAQVESSGINVYDSKGYEPNDVNSLSYCLHSQIWKMIINLFLKV
ncbi:UNVERIFIED_CONTAM: zinc finger CCHC domain-containing protein 8 [Trichonephila clavipes]